MGEVVYTAYGVRHKYDVDKVSDSKWAVRKKTKASGKLIKSHMYQSELSAKREADRMAKNEGSMV